MIWGQVTVLFGLACLWAVTLFMVSKQPKGLEAAGERFTVEAGKRGKGIFGLFRLPRFN